jgi:hypothetical protein
MWKYIQLKSSVGLMETNKYIHHQEVPQYQRQFSRTLPRCQRWTNSATNCIPSPIQHDWSAPSGFTDSWGCLVVGDENFHSYSISLNTRSRYSVQISFPIPQNDTYRTYEGRFPCTVGKELYVMSVKNESTNPDAVLLITFMRTDVILRLSMVWKNFQKMVLNPSKIQ